MGEVISFPGKIVPLNATIKREVSADGVNFFEDRLVFPEPDIIDDDLNKALKFEDKIEGKLAKFQKILHDTEKKNKEDIKLNNVEKRNLFSILLSNVMVLDPLDDHETIKALMGVYYVEEG